MENLGLRLWNEPYESDFFFTSNYGRIESENLIVYMLEGIRRGNWINNEELGEIKKTDVACVVMSEKTP